MNGLVQRVCRLLSVVRWQLLVLIGYFGWAGARDLSRLMAGMVGTAAPGRARRVRRLAFAHPTSSWQPDPFSKDNLGAALHHKYGRWPETPSDCAVIEAASSLANCAWPRLFSYQPLFVRKGDPAAHTYRAVVRFNMADALVQLVAAQHLARCVDPDLSDSSWARRLRCASVFRPTRNDPAARMLAYRRHHAGKVVWVAKLDVQRLHDTISHAAVRKAVAQAVARAARRGVVIDWRVLCLIETLLTSYSFGADVVTGASKILKGKDPEGTVSWPLETLKEFHPDPLTAGIGLAQGSPLSDILANLLLHFVDGAVVNHGFDQDLFYVRWMDDLVVVHTSRAACEAAVKRAMEALHKLELIPHEPKTFDPSDVAYWRAKSIGPTPWAPRGKGREWFGVLGYEIKFDGEVRIRRETLQRHKSRLRRMVDRRQNEFDGRLTALGGGAATWFVREAARGVARLERDLAGACMLRRPCWIRCFPLAALGGEALARQARDLDRFRRLLLSRYRRHVKEQSRQLGVAIGDVRRIRDHYRRSYYFNLVARFAARAAVVHIVPSRARSGGRASRPARSAKHCSPKREAR